MLLAVVFAALTSTSCTTPNTARDARLLFRTLLEQEGYYQKALQAEERTLLQARALLKNLDRGTSQREVLNMDYQLATVRARFRYLQFKLNVLHPNSPVRQELLLPVLVQLQTEQEELNQLRDLFGRCCQRLRSASPGATPDELQTFAVVLDRHRQPKNLFTPALKRIRETYPFARRHTWRGHPLTA